MTPARSNSSKRNSSITFKPYTRGIVPLVLSSSVLDSKQSAAANVQANTLVSTSPSDNAPFIPVERPGFPTYAQYKKVEAAYIQSLTPRRQGKALISQTMFDRIWDVLSEPDLHGETPQFRFWARKMFTLSKTHRSTLNPFDDDPPEEVLLHDNLLVAVQEQLYDLLCYCHGSTGHGGRDKTCTLIRKHYTWVPKDLVSGFIKACPTCIMKKCGHLNSSFASQMAGERSEDAKISRKSKLSASSGSIASDAVTVVPVIPARSVSISSPTPASPGDSPSKEIEEFDPIEIAYREAVQRARGVKGSLSGLAVARPQGAAVTREVSLYQGLQNGQYAFAYAEFMKPKGLGLFQDDAPGVQARRPRIPSILPLWPDHYIEEEYEQEENSVQDTSFANSPDVITPPLTQASQQQISGLPSYSSLSLQYLLGHSQSLVDFKEESQSFVQQIDPSLLQLSPGSVSQSPSNATGSEADKRSNHATYANSTSISVPMSLKRAAAPPRLEIDFLTYRTGLREADVTPDSPLTGINWDVFNPSPTRSDSSSPSRASQFAPPLSATTSMSPPSSALRTPVDEFPNGTNEGDLGFRVIKGSTKVEAVEIELSDGIQQVCEL